MPSITHYYRTRECITPPARRREMPLAVSRPSNTSSPAMYDFHPAAVVHPPRWDTPFATILEQHPSPPPPTTYTIHPMLNYSTFTHRETSPFTWDLTIDPTAIRSRDCSNPQWTVPYALMESATTPEMREITIKCPNIQLEINVAASNGTFVAVHDVLHCIYRHLRTQITPEEYKHMEMKMDSVQLEAVIQSYEARYRAIVDDDAVRELEKKKGLKRIDLLTNRRFTGLASTHRPDEFNILPAPL